MTAEGFYKTMAQFCYRESMQASNAVSRLRLQNLSVIYLADSIKASEKKSQPPLVGISEGEDSGKR